MNHVAPHAGLPNSATAGADSPTPTDSTTSKTTAGLESAGSTGISHNTGTATCWCPTGATRVADVSASTPREGRQSPCKCTKGAHKTVPVTDATNTQSAHRKPSITTKRQPRKQCPSSSTLRPRPRVCTKKPRQQTRTFRTAPRTHTAVLPHSSGCTTHSRPRPKVKHNTKAHHANAPTTAPHTHKLRRQHRTTAARPHQTPSRSFAGVRLAAEHHRRTSPVMHTTTTRPHMHTKCCSFFCPQMRAAHSTDADAAGLVRGQVQPGTRRPLTSSNSSCCQQLAAELEAVAASTARPPEHAVCIHNCDAVAAAPEVPQHRRRPHGASCAVLLPACLQLHTTSCRHVCPQATNRKHFFSTG
jgi:hypothetical protein